MRRGTSLVEVLVATVLLAVGVAGTLAALASAARLRTAARAQERVAAAGAEAFSAFVAEGCGVADSLITSASDSGGPHVCTRIVRSADRAELDVAVWLDVPLLRARLTLRSEHPCA
jgi:Tfp pilus assembly protein PilV